MTVRPGTSDDLAVEIALQNFSESDAAKLLQAFDQPLPWPEQLKWQVSEPIVGLRLAAGELALTVQTGAGELLLSGRRWPWQSAGVTLEQVNDTWRIDSLLGLMAAGKVEARGYMAGRPLYRALPKYGTTSCLLGGSLRYRTSRTISTIARPQHLGRYPCRSGPQYGHRRPLQRWLKGYRDILGGFHGDWQNESVKATLEDIRLTGESG